MEAFLYIITFTYGIIIGSFLNVLIYRIPKKENFIISRSHCMNCGYQLKWYDLVPVFSYLFLRGRCRKCGEKISLQYPFIELLNGILYILIFWKVGFNVDSILYCIAVSAMLALSVIDLRTFEIPFGFNVCIACTGAVMLGLHFRQWQQYVIGFFAISLCLYGLVVLSNGRAMGMGDVKLMAAAGLLVGWQHIILAFFLACIVGSIIHIIRMAVTKAEHVLAMGPYLSIGIYSSILFGNEMIQWYIHSVMGL